MEGRKVASVFSDCVVLEKFSLTFWVYAVIIDFICISDLREGGREGEGKREGWRRERARDRELMKAFGRHYILLASEMGSKRKV